MAGRFRRLRRGQAMVEYSLLNVVIAMALLVTVSTPFFRAGDQPIRRNLIELFLDAYQSYYDSISFVLNLPFP